MSSLHNSKLDPIWLSHFLAFDTKAGVLIWKRSLSKRVKSGSIAGGLTKSGRQVIGIRRKIYRAEDVAWFLLYKRWPPYRIGFKNNNPMDLCPGNMFLIAPLAKYSLTPPASNLGHVIRR